MLKLALAQALLAASSAGAIAQTSGASSVEKGVAYPKLALDAEREKHAFRVFLKDIQHQIVTTAEAMPVTKPIQQLRFLFLWFGTRRSGFGL